MEACEHRRFDITPEQVRRARQGYLANISYIDDKVGEILEVLRTTRMLDDTIIVFTSDHGDMLGERGLWFKMNFFEGSVRVPLMIAGKGIAPQLISQPVSTLDINPTLAALGGIDIAEVLPWTDGEDLTPVMQGKDARRSRSDGICGGRLECAARLHPRRQLQVRALRDRPAATL